MSVNRTGDTVLFWSQLTNYFKATIGLEMGKTNIHTVAQNCQELISMKRTKLKVTIFLSKIISTCHLTVWHYLCACFNLTVN